MNLSFKKKTDFTRFFTIKLTHPGRVKKSRSGLKKPAVEALITCG